MHTETNFSVLVPAGEYVEGLRTLLRHNRQGQPAFFLGEVSRTGGWKLYYPVVILLKWPALVLFLCVVALILTRRRLRVFGDLWIMASFPLAYLLMTIFTRFNLGERHVLPVYAFVLFFAGSVWEGVNGRCWLATLLVVAVLLQAADSARYAPDYLSYFSFPVRPAKAYKLLSGSNLDWGQGLLALRRYEGDHPAEQPWLAYFGSVDPIVYGIRARPLAENTQVTGTVIVSATSLSGEYLHSADGYRWLLRYKPVAILDHSLYVFRIGEN